MAYQVLADLNEQPLNIIDVISSYISKALEEGTIICFRTTQEGKVSGWYDSKKNLIYLPYRDYYSNFNEYWNESHKHAFPFTKERFQKELLEEKVLVVHESQKKGNYRRCQCQVIVDPPVEGQPSVQRPVLKVNIGKLTLSPEAEQQLKKLDKIIVPRRRKSIKSTG